MHLLDHAAVLIVPNNLCFSGGPKSYFSNTQTGSTNLAIHNHANNERTIGMGEFVAVLNGVEFRTRHNDYRYLDRKIPNISPGLIEVRRHILGGIIFGGGLYSRGLYSEGILC